MAKDEMLEQNFQRNDLLVAGGEMLRIFVAVDEMLRILVAGGEMLRILSISRGWKSTGSKL